MAKDAFDRIPRFEPVPLSDYGKRKMVFDRKRIRYADVSGADYNRSMLIGLQNGLALAQFLCNMGHERSMGRATPIAPIFDWMERFITIAASKGFPEMPKQYTDAMMWGMWAQEDRASFSQRGLRDIIGNMEPGILSVLAVDHDYDSIFRNNPDPNFIYRITERELGAVNKWRLKYPARGIAIQWMMESARREMEFVVDEIDEMAPTTHIKLLREAYSLVEACYAEWVEFLRNSGQLGTFYSPELAGIVEAPQERRPPPLLEH